MLRCAPQSVRAGEDEYEVPAGGAIVVPGNTEHTFWNPRPEPARYLLVMGARTHALVEAIHSTEDRSPKAIQDLFESYGAKLLE